GMKAFLFCPDGVVSALKQPFFSKNSKKDKHQNDVCLQSERSSGPFYHELENTKANKVQWSGPFYHVLCCTGNE
ncbi:hypothetical protein, partial [Streptococcus suis]|uniref:hypothetical protein n=1 Tax=Streptococcus suis TaxID=1307 RepID=UPI003D6BA444